METARCGPFERLCCANQDNEKYQVYQSTEIDSTRLVHEELVSSPTTSDFFSVGPGTPKAAWATGSQKTELVEQKEKMVEDGSRYRGQWKGNFRHGHGFLTMADGQTYEGNFEDSRAHGHGVWQESSGTTYEGQWKRHRKQGFGKYRHVDGTVYEGEWYFDQKSGRGIETWLDGTRYEGEFLQGRKHGVGIYKCIDTRRRECRYEGQWASDQMDGEGRYEFQVVAAFRVSGRMAKWQAKAC